jgi:hypothetical protein
MIEVQARYEGFAPSLFAEVNTGATSNPSTDVQAAPRAVTRVGETAVIQTGSEVVLPVTIQGTAPRAPRTPFNVTATNAKGETTVDGRKTASCGVSLEVTPKIINGDIILSGRSTVHQVIQSGPDQRLNAVSFTTRETVFSEKVVDGQPLVVRVGDGPADKSQITLTLRTISSR